MPAIFPIRLSACPAVTHPRGAHSTITSYPSQHVSRVVHITGGKHLAPGLRLAIARFGADVLQTNPGRSFLVTPMIPRPHRKPPGWDALVATQGEMGGNQWLREGDGPWFTSEPMQAPAENALGHPPVVAQGIGAAAAVIALLAVLVGTTPALARGQDGGAKPGECQPDARTTCTVAQPLTGPKPALPAGTYTPERERSPDRVAPR